MTNSKIEARTKSLRELLDNQKYKVDYFQREYKWESKQLQQLLLDLEDAFFSSYQDGDTIEDVVNFNTYFLGPIILSDHASSKSIIDGQQRLTTLTLLLIHLNKLQANYEEKENIDSLIYSKRHGRKSYNIEVPDRTDVLDALYLDKDIYDKEEQDFVIGLFAENAQKVDKSDESVQNMIDRYNDIRSFFNEEFIGDLLLMFIDFIKEKLVFVEIVAFNDDNAFTIFETMNDRGLSLTPTEMLKGYLLSNIKDEEFREDANLAWKKKISDLHRYSVKEDSEFIKAWFRGQHAVTQRSRSRGAANEDFERIGTHFHTWVKDNSRQLGLSNSESIYYFIKKDFIFYCEVYERVLSQIDYKAKEFSIASVSSYYNIATSLSLPLYLSCISKLDNDKIIDEKIEVVARFLDSYSVGRSVNQKSIGQSSISYSLFGLIKKVRNADVSELREIFSNELAESGAEPFNISDLIVTSKNYKFVRYLLSRIVYDYNFDQFAVTFNELISRRKKNRLVPIQIIPSNRYDIYSEYFQDEEAYSYFTSLIGNYLLAPIEFFNQVDSLTADLRIDYLKNLTNVVPNILPVNYGAFTLEDFGNKFDQVAIDERGYALNRIAQKIWNSYFL